MQILIFFKLSHCILFSKLKNELWASTFEPTWRRKSLKSKPYLLRKSQNIFLLSFHNNPLWCSRRSPVLSVTGVKVWFLFRHHPQILMHGETCSHPVTPYSKSITLPSIWTTRWPETSLWDLCTWRASMWPKQATGRFKTTGTLVNTPQTPSCVWPASLCAYVLVISCLWFAPSRAAGREWHVGEGRRSSRCVPHHPAALPLGRPGHQRLRAHGGQTQIPDGGTVWSVDSSTL